MCIVLSLFAAYFFLAGCAIAGFHRGWDRVFERTALAVALGILVNYSVTLTGLELRVLWIGGSVIALFGLLRFVKALRAPAALADPVNAPPVLATVLVAYVLVIYYFQILSEPLLRWDARSVWFFHAKIIWTQGAFRGSAWNHPSIAFASPDYPNLVPALAAQLAWARGYWNEFLPKGSLVLMLLPLVLWLVSFRERSLGFLLLVVLFFFSLHAWLWNGYMDGYLVMYCALALLAFGRFARQKQDTDLYSGSCALGIAAATKNEGLLFAVCAVSAVLLLGTRVSVLSPRGLLKRVRTDGVFAAVLFMSVFPTLLWTVLKKAWGIENHLIGVGGTFERIWTRLSDAVTPLYILRFLATRASVAWLLLALIIFIGVVSRYRRVEGHPGAALALAATMLYCCGMYVMYFITPANLTWHLGTSATRVMATVSFGLLIAIFFQLSALEGQGITTMPADRAADPPIAQSVRSGNE